MTINDEFVTLDQLALEMTNGGQDPGGKPATGAKPAGPAKPAAGGDKIGDFLKSPSGETLPGATRELTCGEALAAHCSGKCTNGALDLLKSLQQKK